MASHQSQQSLRVVFAGGGTGGHIMPGAAVADALTQRDPTIHNLFLTTPRDGEQHVHHALADHEVVEIPAARWDGVVQKLLFSRAAIAAANRCLNIYKHFHPDVVVGLGGYSCVVPVMVATMLGRPTMIFESNAIPGRVTRVLSPVANCVQLQWKETASHLNARRTIVTGNPIRPHLLTTDRARAQRHFMLDPNRRTLLVMGGSQGAQPINERLADALQVLEQRSPDILRKLQVLHLTGPDHLAECRARTWPSDAIYRPVGFARRMEDAYAVADVVICRAGGSTLAELTALGLPSLLVPYPHAKDDHQTANARCLERRGAARLIPQSELSSNRLASFIERILQRPELLHDMSLESYRAGHPRASERVADAIHNLAGIQTSDKLSEPEQKRTMNTIITSLFQAA